MSFLKLSRSSYFGFQKTLYAPEGIVAERTSLNVVLGKDSDRASALISDLVSLFDREVFRICETACSDDSHGADASVGDVTILSFDLSGLV